jgi:hypothetical protein
MGHRLWEVTGAPFAAFDCLVSHRHLPTPSDADGQNGSTVPDRAVAVLPFAPSARVRGSMVGYSRRSHRHLLVLPVVRVGAPVLFALVPPLAHELATDIRCDGCFVVRGGGTLLPCRAFLHLARSIND